MNVPLHSCVNVVLVGVGGFGTIYARAFLAEGTARGAKLVGCVDPHAARVECYAQLSAAGVPFFASLEQALAVCRVELVVLATPIQFHTRDALLALARGACVLLEKPVAGSWRDAWEIRQAAHAAQRWVAVGFQWSFAEATQRCKADILAGAWGHPLFARGRVLWPRPQSYYQRNSWAGRVRSADGVAINDNPVSNATAHFLHHILFLLGASADRSADVAEVTGRVWRAYPIETFDSAALRLVTRDGVRIDYAVSHAVRESAGPSIEMVFDRGTIVYEDADRKLVGRYRDGSLVTYGDPDEGGHAAKLWQCVACLQNGSLPRLQIEGALPHMQVVEAVAQLPVFEVRSAELGFVELPGGDMQRVLPEAVFAELESFPAGAR